MSLSTLLTALVRGGDGSPRPLRSSAAGDLMTAAGLPPYTELARIGAGWAVMNTSALAALVVRPSTVAGLTLWNGDPVKSYVIDRVGAFNLVTEDAIADWSVWGCVHPAGMTEPTADITAIKSYSGNRKAYPGHAVVDTGATVLDDGWFILDTAGSKVGNSGTTTPGTAVACDTGGRFILPPSAGFSINVVASTTGNTFTHMISWFELALANE